MLLSCGIVWSFSLFLLEQQQLEVIESLDWEQDGVEGWQYEAKELVPTLGWQEQLEDCFSLGWGQHSEEGSTFRDGWQHEPDVFWVNWL